ncbi:hypothetical protein EAG_02131 [Camponotus floridanus]|uniref:Uncharacterized protein n=1 Tax=Camponotus floridanus TaxID=104421 RepID=E2B1R3_CAMFO|nr:hypothetical protein EAG_02131 [Camponotus floridanus]
MGESFQAMRLHSIDPTFDLAESRAEPICVAPTSSGLPGTAFRVPRAVGGYADPPVAHGVPYNQPLGLSIRRRLTCPGEGGDLLDQLLPFGVRPVVVVLTAGSFADLRLTASRALSGRASRQQGDLIDDILHLIGERIRFFTGLRTAVKLLLLLLLLLLSGFETRTMLERLGVATPIVYGSVGRPDVADCPGSKSADAPATSILADTLGRNGGIPGTAPSPSRGTAAARRSSLQERTADVPSPSPGDLGPVAGTPASKPAVPALACRPPRAATLDHPRVGHRSSPQPLLKANREIGPPRMMKIVSKSTYEIVVNAAIRNRARRGEQEVKLPSSFLLSLKTSEDLYLSDSSYMRTTDPKIATTHAGNLFGGNLRASFRVRPMDSGGKLTEWNLKRLVTRVLVRDSSESGVIRGLPRQMNLGGGVSRGEDLRSAITARYAKYAQRPVIVDTMARNDCFTPPLARELGNKLAAGLISLSRSMTAPPRLRRQGLMSEGVSRPDAGPEDMVEIVSRRTAGSARSLTRSAASLKTGQFRLKRRRGGKVRGADILKDYGNVIR